MKIVAMSMNFDTQQNTYKFDDGLVIDDSTINQIKNSPVLMTDYYRDVINIVDERNGTLSR
jgi:hypothetical protein